MAKLIYSALASLDGYVADADGNFDWAAPDEEVHTFVNDLERPVGTYLYGRRMYDTMVYWETAPSSADEPAFYRDFVGIWRAADKIVYSRTLETTASETNADRANVRRGRDPTPEGVGREGHRRGRGRTGGPGAHGRSGRRMPPLRHPVVVGGGTSWLPDGLRVDLELLGERRFGSGVVYLHYRIIT